MVTYLSISQHAHLKTAITAVVVLVVVAAVVYIVSKFKKINSWVLKKEGGYVGRAAVCINSAQTYCKSVVFDNRAT